MRNKDISFNGVIVFKAPIKELTKDEKYQTVWDKILEENRIHHKNNTLPKAKNGRPIKKVNAMKIEIPKDKWHSQG
jgi:hypothetical protein